MTFTDLIALTPAGTAPLGQPVGPSTLFSARRACEHEQARPSAAYEVGPSTLWCPDCRTYFPPAEGR